MRHLKEDNRGVTLIELIVAVAIFATVGAILLRAFVTSSRMNKKSETYLEATTVAQNVMEDVKGKTFEETALAFNYPIDKVTKSSRFSFLEEQFASEDAPIVREVLPAKSGARLLYQAVRRSEASGGNAALVNASVYSANGGMSYTFRPRTTGENASKYYFTMENVAGEHQKFDVLTEFDGSADSGYKKKVYTQEDEKNDYEMPNIAQLDTKSNGFLIMGKEWDEEAMKNMVAEQLHTALNEWMKGSKGAAYDPALKPDEHGLDVADVYANTKRILQIQIVEEGGVVTARARYTLHAYNYSSGRSPYETMSFCPCGGRNLEKDRTDPDWVNGCFCTYVSPYTAFYSSEAGEELKGIYVLYSPNYNSTSRVHPLDEIRIDNQNSKNFDLYIIKQQDDALTGSTSLASYSQKEAAYRMKLKIDEGTVTGSALTANKAHIRLRSNLNTNISNTETVNDRIQVNQQMYLTYENHFGNRRADKEVGAQKLLDFKNLDVRTAYDRIYRIKISVYKEGAAKRNFPAEDLVVSLDGSKEN